MSYSPLLCPCCGKEMSYFQKTPTMNTLTCKECKSVYTVKTSWGITQELLLAIISVLTGIIALMAFFDIHSINDFGKTNNLRAISP
jgi:transposase-like protein